MVSATCRRSAGGEGPEERLLRAQAGEHHIVDGDGEAAVDGVVLGEIAHDEAVGAAAVAHEDDLSPCRLQQSEEDAHERGLAASVGADDAHIVVVLNMNGGMLEDNLRAVAGGDIVKLYVDHCVLIYCKRGGASAQALRDKHHLLGPVVA